MRLISCNLRLSELSPGASYSPFIFLHLPAQRPVTRAGSGLGWQSDCQIRGKCGLARCDEEGPGGLGLVSITDLPGMPRGQGVNMQAGDP